MSYKVSLFQRIKSTINQHIRHSSFSLTELLRTPFSSLMTILMLGFSLSLPTLLWVISNNIANVESQWRDAAEINLFLEMNSTEPQRQSLLAKVRAMPEVVDAIYINPDDALAEFQARSQFGDALRYLDSNPLPAVIRVLPNERYSQEEPATELKERLAQFSGVAVARLDLDWLQRLQALTNVARRAGIGLSALLVVAVVLITGNTIRLSIMQHFHEIKVMKLVGATEAFIRRPFLYGGVWYGLLSGIIALMLVNTLLIWLDGAVAQLFSLYDSQMYLEGLNLQDSMILLLLASSLSLLGAWMSVRQHIRAIEPR